VLSRLLVRLDQREFPDERLVVLVTVMSMMHAAMTGRAERNDVGRVVGASV